jgi:hypothetical protein
MLQHRVETLESRLAEGDGTTWGQSELTEEIRAWGGGSGWFEEGTSGDGTNVDSGEEEEGEAKW